MKRSELIKFFFVCYTLSLVGLIGGLLFVERTFKGMLVVGFIGLSYIEICMGLIGLVFILDKQANVLNQIPEKQVTKILEKLKIECAKQEGRKKMNEDNK